jgi:hypothetical protein
VVAPDQATFFAGVRYTITVTGGLPPYTMTSSEPALLAVPAVLDGHSFDVVPNNPSVIDVGIQAGQLPVRTVIVAARSAGDGSTVSASIKVARNFLTGYGFSFGNTTCVALAPPCAGGDTVVLFDSTFAGHRRPNHLYRIEKIRGTFAFVDPLNTNNTTDVVTVRSDSTGQFTAVIRVPAGTPTQLAFMRIVDVATGAESIQTFVIHGAAALGPITLIPSTVTLTGPNGTTCGFGTFDVLVFDGLPPYTAICSNPQIQVSNPTSTPTAGQPGRFTFTVGASNTCLNAEQCVVFDSANPQNRATVSITTIKGTTTPPTPLVATPNSITLTCGASGNVTVTGGSGSYTANSTHPRVTATVSGNTVTITRLAGPEVGGPFPTSATISVTDGSSATPITATVPANCP